MMSRWVQLFQPVTMVTTYRVGLAGGIGRTEGGVRVGRGDSVQDERVKTAASSHRLIFRWVGECSTNKKIKTHHTYNHLATMVSTYKDIGSANAGG